jgi:7-cyano-7-deazaguanine synthase in queuosine biosynthesis
MLKIINLTIPDNESVPEIIATFSPEENYLMLKIGSACLREGRNAAIGLSQKEIYQKIKDETKEEVQKLELDIIIQKEITKKMEEKMTKIYEGQVEKIIFII